MQQVNLLTEELQPRSAPLVARHFLLGWCAFGLVLLAITGWQGLSLWGLHGDMASTQSALDKLRAANAQQRAKNVDPQSLRDRIGELRVQQLEQTQLMQLLRSEQDNAGFAAYLNGLARARVDGLWLNEITIGYSVNRQLTLKGATTDALKVPALLQNLASEEEFAGQRFEQIDLTSAPDEDIVEFAIVSPNAGAPG